IGIGQGGVALGNGGTGIVLVSDESLDTLGFNTIANNAAGISIDGANSDSNTILKNSIHNNLGAGIIFTGGAQGGVISPSITTIDPDSTVHGTAAAFALVQIYADSTDEGQYFLDSTYANGSGNWARKVTLIPGLNLTALQDSARSTSGFSAPFAAIPADPFVVTSTLDDSSAGTLRYAIGRANTIVGRNLITFSLPVNDTILVTRPLPNITDTLDIDGQASNVTVSAAPGFTGFSMVSLRAPFSLLRNFNMFGRGIAQRGIFLDNAGAGGNDSKMDNVDALEFTMIGIQGDAVRDTIINSHIAGNTLAGIAPGILWFLSNNIIGTDAGGGAAYGVPQGLGIGIQAYGGITISQNLISGHSVAGIQIVESSYNTIFNNGIGTDVTASVAIPNDYGIIVDSLSKYNQIGLPGAGNVISGNTNFAIHIQNNGADSNYVLANKIGTDITGTVSLGNAIGVATQSTTGPNFIGDGTPAGRNIISANSAHGLYLFGPDVVNGNFIGTDATGTADLGNVAFGAYLYGSNTNIINNVISGNDNVGLYIAGTDNHIVAGNFIGTDSTGNVALPNLAGITLTNVAFGSLIGGTTFADRNVISGNSTSGLRIENGARNISVIGNFVGLSADGQADLGNGTNGIEIDNASGNTIGNGTMNGRNFISGNDNWGVDIQFLADSNTVIGNVLGTDSAGTTGVGYSIVGVNVSGPFNRIGGYQPGQGNVIGGGIGYTVALGNSTDNLVAGNFMGVTAAGVPIAGTSSGFYITGSSRRDSLVGNTIAYLLSSPLIIQDAPTDSITFYGNKIHHNFGDISINASAQFGVQPPRITLVLPDSTVLGNAAPNALVQIFADSSNDGQIFLDTTYANGAGLWSKKVTLFAGMAVTAMQDSLGNTSNFSAPFIPSFAPSAPNGLYAIARNGQVELKWNANTDGLTTKYRIYYDITALPTTLQDSTTGGATDTSKAITGLTNGQLYYFRVAAVNAIGQASGFSNEDAAVPVVEAGNAVSFNGSDYILTSPTLGNFGTSDFSIEAWIKTAATTSAIAGKRHDASNGNFFVFGINGSGQVNLEVDQDLSGTFYGAVTGATPVNDNQWHHVAAVRTGTNLSVYVDGVLDGSAVTPLANVNNADPLSIGARGVDGVNYVFYFNGEIDELRLWDYARNSIQLTADKNKPLRGDEGGLLGLYHFDESDPSTVTYDGALSSTVGSWVNGASFVGSGALAPLAPQGLTATPFVPDSIVVSWNTNKESDLSHYIVYRSTTNGFIPSPSDSIGRVMKPDSMFTDLTALIGNTYYYRVSGVDSNYQKGQYSNQVAGSFPVGILSASIPVINFGNVSLGNNAVIQTKVFVNGGWAEVTGSGFDFGSDFSLVTPLTLPDTLLAGDTILVDVRFSPTAFAALTDTLRLTNNTSVNPLLVVLDGSGVSGTIASNVNPANYGNVSVGSNATQTIKVFSNGGAVEVNSANILAGTNFTITNALTFPDTLFTGDTLAVDVQFAPTAFGALSDTLSITNNSGVPVFKIALDGTGVSGSIASNVNPANYGNVSVGSNATQTIKVYSNGGAVLVSAASILGGTNFTITNALTLPDTLFAGDTLSVDVQFAPTAFGALSDTLVVNNNSGVPVFKIGLDGSGATGSLASTPTSFNFGNVLVSDSLSQTFKVYSIGGAVAVNSSTLDFGSDFILENAPVLPDTLFDGDTLVFDIKFKPTTFGVLSDTVVVTNNSSVNPLKIALDGNGNAGTLATLNPNVNFGEVVVGDSVSQDIKLFAANGIVVVNNLNLLVGTHFTVSSAAVLPDTLFAGDTLNFTIKFKPLIVTSSISDATQFVNSSVVSPFTVSLEGSSLVKPVTPVTIVIYPEADARVSAVNPTTNYGSDPRIYVFGSNTNYQNNESHGYLRFDLSSIPADADVTQATFQIANSDGFAYNYDPNDYLHFVSDDSWNEAAITWNTRPAVTNPPAASWFAWMAGTYDYTFSATSNVLRDSVRNQRQADGKISFNVNNGAGAYYNNYYSREGAPDNARRPQLIITYLPATLATLTPAVNNGNVAVGDSVTQTVKVFATAGSVTVNSTSLDFGANFTAVPQVVLPVTLNYGDTLAVDVQFTPTAFSSLTDTLVVNNNSGVPAFKVALNGTGVSGSIASNFNPANYGNVSVGNNATLTIKVYSNAGAVRVSAANILSGANFTITNVLTFPDTLFAGDTLSVDVQFAPTAFGALTDTLSVTNNSGVPVFKVALDGNGISGTLAASPSSFNFGNLQAGDSLQSVFKVYSVGGAVALTGTSLFAGTQFSIVSTAGPSTLFSGDTLIVNLKFKPLTVGLKNDTIRILNNSGVSPFKLAVSGTGSLGSLFVSANSLTFGSVQIGDSAQQSVKIYGSSNGIDVTNATLASGVHFVIIPNLSLPVTLNIGDTLLATIRFKPKTFAAIVDTAQIINISVNNPLLISLSGTGSTGILAPLSANFGLVTIGDSAQRVLKLYTNSGAVIVDSLKFDFGTEFKFTSANSLPDTVFPGDTLFMGVQYKPLTFATTSDTIRVFNNSSQSVFNVRLNGVGNSGTLVVVPTSANFGNVLVGDSALQTLKVYATGANIIVSAASMETMGDFTIVSTSGIPVTLVAGVDTLFVNVKFKPSSFGPLSDRLIISNNSLLNPVKINVTGTGAAGTLAASPFGYNFGNVLVNDSSQQSIKIFAVTGRVIVNNISLDNGIQYTLSAGSLPDTLGIGDTLIALVKFEPNVTGIIRDTLRIGNNSQVSSLSLGFDGTGQSGALASNVAAYNFGNIKVGSSAQTTIKLYSLTGQVIISSLAIGTSGRHTLTYSASLPATLNAGDTLVATARFTPSGGGTILDTVYVGNNSAVAVYGISLSGFGVVNSAPIAFAGKQPGNNIVVNTKTPTFTWEGRGDADGDTLRYTLQISKTSNFSSMVQFSNIADTAFTLSSPLDSLGTYFWRVSANDNQGGITVTSALSFNVDAVNPGLFVGVLASTIMQNYIEVYVQSDEALNSLTGSFILRDASNAIVADDTLALTNLSGLLYSVPYRLSVSGELTVSITGVDTVGNTTTAVQLYTITSVTAKAPIALKSVDGYVTVNGAKESVDRSGYVLVTRLSGVNSISPALAKVISRENVLPKELLSEAASAWMQIGESVKILSTVEIKKTLTVTFKYDPSMTSGVSQRYPDFEESKIGIYREDNGQWIYEGGEGNRETVTAKIGKSGTLAMFYNPEHVELPTRIELVQNYPNPFNPSTTIKFGLPDEGKIKLVIYNVLGQKVRELINESREAGFHTVIWNGKNDMGQQVSSGLYIYRLETLKGVQSKKMLLIK
ncbi:choice-of-anchor D domain-containing protein, partial [bacterium]|nr:choice-of-anchor D domain-containing protein [bacterium]